jgi:SWI/SNF-related matrix-associated actin-dependent regulator 1 of chromatin subfamily A
MTSNFKLSQYQIDGAYFLAQNRFALLADQPGVGKTAQAILACDSINAKNILVICPAVARVNWRREFSEWSVFSADFKVCFALKDSVANKMICSYDYATENFEKIKKVSWDVVICDESHFIKEPTAKRTINILGKNGIIRSTKRLWDLSGTPAPNHVGEMWPMLYTFGVTSLKHEDFVETYCNTKATYYGGKFALKAFGTKKSKIPEIQKMLSGVMLRRLKKDVLKDLPPIFFEQVSVEGTPLLDVINLDMSEVKRQQKMAESKLAGVSADKLAEAVESLGSSMSTLRRYVGLQKVKAVAELITQELLDGAYEKIGIFAWHTDVIAQLKKELSQFNPVVVNGSVSAPMRQGSIDSFQTNPKTKVFIGNIQAAGTAITLTAAHEGLFIEESWVPGENLQAADRFHRRGQTMPVRIRIASLADSIDEKVTAVLVRKMNELAEIFNTPAPTGE